jgi:hypothetical protein
MASMRRHLVVYVAVFGLTGMQLHRPTEANQAAATVPVNVDVRCPDQSVQFSVNPWSAELRQGDEIEWVLSDSAQSSEITITSKQGGWPFTNNPPYTGNRTNPPHGRSMKPNQAGRHFSYAIQLVCQRPGSSPDTVVIDPQIVIH